MPIFFLSFFFNELIALI